LIGFDLICAINANYTCKVYQGNDPAMMVVITVWIYLLGLSIMAPLSVANSHIYV